MNGYRDIFFFLLELGCSSYTNIYVQKHGCYHVFFKKSKRSSVALFLACLTYVIDQNLANVAEAEFVRGGSYVK